MNSQKRIMAEINLGIDAGRLLFGLSRIGYTTTSAICDIIDNSVRANADTIQILIERDRKELTDSRKNNVKEYLIIDDGDGMSEDGIKEALKLGATDKEYEEFALAKFGLGLKSAAFSQGDVLEVVSSDGEGSFHKYKVSLPKIIDRKEYFAFKEDLSKVDQELIEEYLPNKKGTIIRIGEVRKANHPSVKSTIRELEEKLGVIYFYFIRDSGLLISIEDHKISKLDPLFIEEANENGNLNEFEWDGKSVRWIEKNTELTLDDDDEITAQIEITQLPYPPIFKVENPNENKDAEIRKQYLIKAKNYGFYVYRNKRLISWASNLQGIIPQDQDYYSFRGRILIDDSADDYFNIDVKKANLTLSEEAWNTISDFSQQAKSKSKAAWKRMSQVVTSIINKEPNEIANIIVSDFERPALLPGDRELPEEDFTRRLHQVKNDMEAKVKIIARMMEEDMGEEIKDLDNLTSKQREIAIKGKNSLQSSKIFRVSSVIDNHLWEPYNDADLGNCVRINKFHRYARLIYEDNNENKGLQIIFDLLLLQLAEAEVYAYTTIEGDYGELKRILTEFRRISSEFLANLVRKREGSLPPDFKGNEF